jgi:hypothetical protein
MRSDLLEIFCYGIDSGVYFMVGVLRELFRKGGDVLFEPVPEDLWVGGVTVIILFLGSVYVVLELDTSGGNF